MRDQKAEPAADLCKVWHGGHLTKLQQLKLKQHLVFALAVEVEGVNVSPEVLITLITSNNKEPSVWSDLAPNIHIKSHFSHSKGTKLVLFTKTFLNRVAFFHALRSGMLAPQSAAYQ